MFRVGKYLLDMTNKDWQEYCIHNTDSEGFCRKDCQFYDSEICKAIHNRDGDKTNIDLKKLLEELEKEKDNKIVYLKY